MVENKLEKSFENYVEFVFRNLKGQGQDIKPVCSKPIFHISELREEVKQFVETPEFSDLVKNTKSALSEVEVQEIKDVVWISYYRYFHTELVEDYDKWWIYAIRNFFCRSVQGRDVVEN